MVNVRAGDFAAHLHSRIGYRPPASVQQEAAGATGGRSLRKLWEASELSASDFADEVARFFDLPRLALPDLLAARPLAAAVLAPLPARGDDLSVRSGRAAPPPSRSPIRPTPRPSAPPTSCSASGLAIRVASFEDIATALDQRLGDEQAGPAAEGAAARPAHEDDIDSLRDLASGAPVVRAVNDLFETAVELRASDIHIEPVAQRPWWCACASTACCARCRRRPACCRRR